MTLIKIILFVALGIYLLRFLFALLFPLIMKKLMDKLMQQSRNTAASYSSNTTKPEGEVTIQQKPGSKKQSDTFGGEYVEFEEVK